MLLASTTWPVSLVEQSRQEAVGRLWARDIGRGRATYRVSEPSPLCQGHLNKACKGTASAPTDGVVSDFSNHRFGKFLVGREGWVGGCS